MAITPSQMMKLAGHSAHGSRAGHPPGSVPGRPQLAALGYVGGFSAPFAYGCRRPLTNRLTARQFQSLPLVFHAKEPLQKLLRTPIAQQFIQRSPK
jgi:hypothetical protein